MKQPSLSSAPATTLPEDVDISQVPLTQLEQRSGYWRKFYASQRKLHDISIRQIILGQIFTIVIAAAAGVFLEENKQALLLAGTTLILYPALSNLLSSSATVLAAGLHHDIDSIGTGRLDRLKLTGVATLKAILVAMTASTILGVAAAAIGVWLFEAAFMPTVELALWTGLIVGLIGLPCAVLVMFGVRLLHSNPDDVTAPIENTLFSALTLLAIIFVSRWLA